MAETADGGMAPGVAAIIGSMSALWFLVIGLAGASTQDQAVPPQDGAVPAQEQWFRVDPRGLHKLGGLDRPFVVAGPSPATGLQLGSVAYRVDARDDQGRVVGYSTFRGADATHSHRLERDGQGLITLEETVVLGSQKGLVTRLSIERSGAEPLLERRVFDQIDDQGAFRSCSESTTWHAADGTERVRSKSADTADWCQGSDRTGDHQTMVLTRYNGDGQVEYRKTVSPHTNTNRVSQMTYGVSSCLASQEIDRLGNTEGRTGERGKTLALFRYGIGGDSADHCIPEEVRARQVTIDACPVWQVATRERHPLLVDTVRWEQVCGADATPVGAWRAGRPLTGSGVPKGTVRIELDHDQGTTTYLGDEGAILETRRVAWVQLAPR